MKSTKISSNSGKVVQKNAQDTSGLSENSEIVLLNLQIKNITAKISHLKNEVDR